MAASLHKIHHQFYAFGNQEPKHSKKLGRFTAKATGNENENKNPAPSDPSTDWDKAWSSYQNQKRKPLFDLNMEKYVTRKPSYREYPLTEEIDQFRKADRSNLQVWNYPKFTYAGFSVIFGMFVYMVINGPHA